MAITKYKRIQIQVLGVVVLIVLLNAFVFTGLDINQKNSLHHFTASLFVSGIFYPIILVLSFICILLNKNTYLRWIFIGLLAFMTLHILFNLYYLITDPQINY